MSELRIRSKLERAAGELLEPGRHLTSKEEGCTPAEPTTMAAGGSKSTRCR